jgi:hypothetical protein
MQSSGPPVMVPTPSGIQESVAAGQSGIVVFFAVKGLLSHALTEQLNDLGPRIPIAGGACSSGNPDQQPCFGLPDGSGAAALEDRS